MRAKVIGAHGGNRFGLGGPGGQVDAIVDVPAGVSTLYVLVGGTGERAASTAAARASPRTPEAAAPPTFARPRARPAAPARSGPPRSHRASWSAVAAAEPDRAAPPAAHGGGQANGNGNTGGVCAADPASNAAQGGTQTAGGATGGVQGSGGGNANGGGGGGGLYGGGASPASTRGGAGGSSFGPAGATFTTTGTAAQVQITPFFSTTTTVTASPSPTNYGEERHLHGHHHLRRHRHRDGPVLRRCEPARFAAGRRRGQQGDVHDVDAHHRIAHDQRGLQRRLRRRGEHSAGLPHTVAKQATKTMTTSGHNPSKFGESVTFTATVTPSAGSQPIDAGNVQFYLGGTPFGSPQPINPATGQASLTTSALAVGNQAVSARWLASTNYEATSASDATSVTQVVGKMDTTTTVGSTASPTGLGASVTFTATVAPDRGHARRRLGPVLRRRRPARLTGGGQHRHGQGDAVDELAHAPGRTRSRPPTAGPPTSRRARRRASRIGRRRPLDDRARRSARRPSRLSGTTSLPVHDLERERLV